MKRNERNDEQRPAKKRGPQNTRSQEGASEGTATGGDGGDSNQSSRVRESDNVAPEAHQRRGIIEISASTSSMPLEHPMSSIHMNPFLASTVISSVGSNGVTFPLPTQMVPIAEMSASLAQRLFGQAPPQPPFGVGVPDEMILSLSIIMQQQHYQNQQRLAAFAASLARGGPYGAVDPFLMSALFAQNAHTTPALPPGMILGANLPPPFASIPINPSLLPVPQPGLSPADILVLSRQQTASMLLSQNAQQQQAQQGMGGSFPLPFNFQGQSSASLSFPRQLPAAAALTPSILPWPLQPAGATLFPPVRTAPLYLPRDEDVLSDHQILLRQQIEFFQARPADIHSFTPCRRKEISVNQVGIRCIHCAAILQTRQRSKGSMYFPSTLRAIYQAAQNMGTTHFQECCPVISAVIRDQLHIHVERKAVIGYGGKQYWAEGAQTLGIYETEMGLRFCDEEAKEE